MRAPHFEGDSGKAIKVDALSVGAGKVRDLEDAPRCLWIEGRHIFERPKNYFTTGMVGLSLPYVMESSWGLTHRLLLVSAYGEILELQVDRYPYPIEDTTLRIATDSLLRRIYREQRHSPSLS